MILTHLLIRPDDKYPDRVTLGQYLLNALTEKDYSREPKKGIEDKIKALEAGFEWLVEVLYQKGQVTAQEVVEADGWGTPPEWKVEE